MCVTGRRLVLVLAAAALAVLALAQPRPQPAHAGITFTVTWPGDQVDFNVGDGICDIGGSVCTLRAALQEANADAGLDAIQFSTTWTIAVLSPLPPITEEVNIAGTFPSGVQLSGGSCTGCAYGLAVTGGSGSQIRYLTINGFASGAGVLIAGPSTGTLLGNDAIGTNVAATSAQANATGVVIAASSNNEVSDNVISGNSGAGILITGCAPPPGSGCSNTEGNTIEESDIGTNGSGTAAIGNGTYGVYIDGTSPSALVDGNTFTGEAGSHNVVSGNGSNGIRIAGANASANSLNHLLVGTNAADSSGIPNGSHGIYITGGAHDNDIVGTGGNDIAFNHGAGIAIDGGGTGNYIWDTTIHDNDDLGIDVAPLGAVTPGIQGEVDAALACPSCASGTGTLTLTGYAHGLPPSAAIAIGVYLNTACDPSGYGEGAIIPHPGTWYIPPISATSDANGDLSLAAQDTDVGNVVGQYVTTYAVYPDQTTTEFSACVLVKSDQDGDGIEDSIDTSPAVVSNAFTDVPGGTTAGTIIDRGSGGSCYVSVVEEPNPDGVILGTLCRSGGAPAHLLLCGSFTVSMPDGTSARERCGSLHNAVDIGPVTVTFGSFSATLPGDTQAVITDLGGGDYRVDNDAASAGNVTVSPPPRAIPPGQSLTLEASPSAGRGSIITGRDRSTACLGT